MPRADEECRCLPGEDCRAGGRERSRADTGPAQRVRAARQRPTRSGERRLTGPTPAQRVRAARQRQTRSGERSRADTGPRSACIERHGSVRHGVVRGAEQTPAPAQRVRAARQRPTRSGERSRADTGPRSACQSGTAASDTEW